MPFVSTAGRTPETGLAEALRRGLAPDGGLYVPLSSEPLPPSFLDRLHDHSWPEIAHTVARHLLGGELGDATLGRIVDDALDFPVPLVDVDGHHHVLELFHGPTLAFKDVGARFLARLLAVTRGADPDRHLTVLAATSGDTGGAVARAFFGVAGTRVVVLYPRGQVSALQERQFATLGGNVRALAVEGSFDDCQRLVKLAFADRELADRLGLTSANSINVGRLLPQVFYYFQAVARLGPHDREPWIAVPSGNFGNLTAGLLAKRLGLRSRFVAATNINDTVPSYLGNGLYEPRPSKRTLSNAMDVGDPSNFARIRWLYDDDVAALRRDLVGSWHDDEATRQAIREVHERHGYLMDPHTAVGWLALCRARPEGAPGIVLATAHPAKFKDLVEPVVGREIPLPPALAERLDAPVLASPLANDFGALRGVLGDS